MKSCAHRIRTEAGEIEDILRESAEFGKEGLAIEPQANSRLGTVASEQCPDCWNLTHPCAAVWWLTDFARPHF